MTSRDLGKQGWSVLLQQSGGRELEDVPNGKEL